MKPNITRAVQIKEVEMGWGVACGEIFGGKPAAENLL
jgi:hypothetical protein